MDGPDGGAGFAGQAPPTGQMPAGQMPFGQLEAGQMPAGGLLNGSAPSADITAMLEADADSYTWVAAAIGSNSASGYQLATEEPVMAIGGFNGTDPSPTLEEFVQYVADGEIHYFIAGGGMGFGMDGGEAGTSTQISEWVAANYTSTTVDGVTLYDLSE
jgi:4-amino-4-deoxy-L-arabinose transferase-like glycosyltransferase